jgi:hypothetical protein
MFNQLSDQQYQSAIEAMDDQEPGVEHEFARLFLDWDHIERAYEMCDGERFHRLVKLAVQELLDYQEFPALVENSAPV